MLVLISYSLSDPRLRYHVNFMWQYVFQSFLTLDFDKFIPKKTKSARVFTFITFPEAEVNKTKIYRKGKLIAHCHSMQRRNQRIKQKLAGNRHKA